MFAQRLKKIAPFKVMEVLARAGALEAAGHEVVHLEVGEPDFSTAGPILEAGRVAIAEGNTKYTAATGIMPLREKIAAHYAELGVEVSPERIIITSGASGGLTLLAALLLNPSDEILITDPGYPCNEVFAQLVGGVPRQIVVDSNNGFQPKARDIQEAWTARTKGVLLASPANPTGTMLASSDLRAIVDFVATQRGFFVLDEIYQGLVRGDVYRTGLTISQELFILNSFSKYFGMTGWRLGWIVVPDEAIDYVTRLAQNLFICPSTPAQYAALSAFNPETMRIHEERARQFDARCERLYEGLLALGFRIPVRPQGAFYLYVDVSHTGLTSGEFCERLLNEYFVAVTPGEDFGASGSDLYVRFAYTTSMTSIDMALDRLADALQAW